MTTEGGRLVADALAAALFDVAEALHSEHGEPAAEPPARDGVPSGRTGRSLASLPTRAVADAAAAIAAAVVPAVVERIDVNALLSRVNVDALVARIDVGRILDQVDVDELVGRIDMAALAREALEGIDIGDLIQESTAGIATDTMDDVRVQAMNADDLLARVVDRLLRRRRPRDVALERRRGS